MIVKEPLVSVIIPTYKRPDFLDRAIDSVLNQTYKNIEVIVVDDNNPDTEGRKRTEGIMEKYSNNPLVYYVKHECNKNGSAARNTGFRVSHGVYVAFLDDDDEFLPEKIAAQVKRLEELPDEYAVCYTKVVFEKENGNISESKENREGDLFFDALTRELSFQAGSNLFIRKEVFDSIGGFDETFKRSQDKEVVTRLLQHHKIAYAPVKGVLAHVYDDHSFVNPFEVTAYYVEKMKPFVDSLDSNMRRNFYKEINGQLFYYSITKKKIGKAIVLILKGKVSLFTAWKILYNGFKSKYLNK